MMKAECICCGKEFEADINNLDKMCQARGSGKTLLTMRNFYTQMCCSYKCKYEINRMFNEIFYGGLEDGKREN